MKVPIWVNISDAESIKKVINELELAREKHKSWGNKGKFERLSLLSEELGEAAKSLNDNEPEDNYRTELAQVAVVVIRSLTE